MRVGLIAEANGMTVEQFRLAFGLGGGVVADTPWKDVKAAVGHTTERFQAGAGYHARLFMLSPQAGRPVLRGEAQTFFLRGVSGIASLGVRRTPGG
ncbi:MAG: hypothetical protein NTU62_13550 [Spirochaetes bacterium]|nr:hypothetical protein [Spirochaetota bacterium]